MRPAPWAGSARLTRCDSPCGGRRDGRTFPDEPQPDRGPRILLACPSRPHAERRLKEAIRDWRAPAAAGVLGPNSRFREIAMGWLAEYERDADRGFNSWGSVDTYKHRLMSDERQHGQDREVGDPERVPVRRAGRCVRDQPGAGHRPDRVQEGQEPTGQAAGHDRRRGVRPARQARR